MNLRCCFVFILRFENILSIMVYFEMSFGFVNVFKIGLIMLLSVVYYVLMSFNGGWNRILIGILILILIWFFMIFYLKNYKGLVYSIIVGL